MENNTERNQECMTAEAKRFEALDRLAYDFSRVQTDINKLCSLNFEEHAYVMSMAYLYTMHRLGRLSADFCKKVKQKLIRECQHIHASYEFARHLQKRWVICTKTYAEDKKELVSMLRRKDPKALRKALQIIDLLSGEYIYTRLADKAGDWNEQIDLFEEVVDEVADEEEYDDKEELKLVIAKIIEALESGEITSPAEYMTEAEIEELLRNIPEKEHLTEEFMKSVMPRVS